jgi:uncharacterized protein YbjQ (UPF0145 family)
MKALRYFGSLAFVLGLVVFIGVPWQILFNEDPPLPLWLKIAFLVLLGGILLVLVTVALERKDKIYSGDAIQPVEPDSDVLLLNSDSIDGYDTKEILGLVQGHTVFAIWLGKDLSALLRLLIGGELTEYTDMMGKARLVATSRMKAEANQLGADAIINVRYMTTSVVGTAAELFAYGTAVKLGGQEI